MEKLDYYVYILFKTYNKGNFTYGDLSFDMEPFYIGKGVGNRLEISKKEFNSSNKHKARILEKIINKDMTVTSLKYMEGLSEKMALDIETDLIKKIGRRDLGLGPLSNLCDGGKGSAGELPGKWKSIAKYNTEGELIKVYQSVKEAAKDNNLSPGNIGYVCNNKRDTCGGFVWRFFNNKNEAIEIGLDKLKNRTQKGNSCVKISQYDLDETYLGSYNSIKECEEKTGCSSSKIVLVCQGKRKQTKGFIFRYEKN
jgi:hypothetical protein